MAYSEIDGRTTESLTAGTFFSGEEKNEWNRLTRYLRKALPKSSKKGYNKESGRKFVPVRIGHAVQYQYAK